MGNTMAKAGWKVTGLLFAVPAGIAARKALDVAWRKTRHTDPPSNPAAPGTDLDRSAALGGGQRCRVRCGTHGRRARGRRHLAVTDRGLPPGLEDSTI